MIKYEYETGMCKQLHYNGLWSVQYEGVPGHFKKVKMVCPCIRDECDQDCEVNLSLNSSVASAIAQGGVIPPIITAAIIS